MGEEASLHSEQRAESVSLERARGCGSHGLGTVLGWTHKPTQGEAGELGRASHVRACITHQKKLVYSFSKGNGKSLKEF